MKTPIAEVEEISGLDVGGSGKRSVVGYTILAI